MVVVLDPPGQVELLCGKFLGGNPHVRLPLAQLSSKMCLLGAWSSSRSENVSDFATSDRLLIVKNSLSSLAMAARGNHEVNIS